MTTSAALAITTEAPPKLYEAGWPWWAWLIAWAVFLLSAAALGFAGRIIRAAVNARRNRDIAAIGSFLLVVVASGLVVAAPLSLMRHMDNGQGAGWAFFGSLAVAAGTAVVALTQIEYALPDSRHDFDSRWTWRIFGHGPGILVALAAVFGGIAEMFTRLAASIPMGIGQLLAFVGAIFVLAIIYVLIEYNRR